MGVETRLGKGSFFSIVKTFSPFSRFLIVNFFPLSPFPTGLRLGLQGFTANGRLKFKVPPKIWELVRLISASFLPVRYTYPTDSKKHKRETANSQEKGIAF